VVNTLIDHEILTAAMSESTNDTFIVAANEQVHILESQCISAENGELDGDGFAPTNVTTRCMLPARKSMPRHCLRALPDKTNAPTCGGVHPYVQVYE